LGFVYRSRTILCRAAPNPNVTVTIRNFSSSQYGKEEASDAVMVRRVFDPLWRAEKRALEKVR
jgi:hypothetical protein